MLATSLIRAGSLALLSHSSTCSAYISPKERLQRLGRNAEAALAYEAAIARTENATKRDFPQR